MTSAPLVAASTAERTVGSWRLGWLAPLAAGVAAVGLWFMVPSRTPFDTAPAPAAEVAATEPQRQQAQAPVEGAPELRDRRAPQSATGDLAADRFDRTQDSKDVPKEPAKLESSLARRADEAAPGQRQENEAKALAKNAADSAGATREELSARATATAPSAPAPPAPSAPSAVSAPAAAAPRAAASAIVADRSANVQTAAVEVVSPNPSMRWRIGGGGMIEHSIDSGATWTPQSSGVSVQLLAGASPSPDVCWLVGRAGTVLRTIDGGREWQRVTLVAGLDLQAVTSTDASTAEVTTADGRRFRTVDAGITWR